jgi:DNA processing protein
LDGIEESISCNYVTIIDKEYPKRLKNIYQPPFVLFYKGDLKILESSKSISVVGSRITTDYGVNATNIVLKDIKKETLVVSGMAKGIDSLAHEKAIEKGMKTVAVLGNGIDIAYPTESKELYNKLIKDYLVISEYGPGVKANKESFKTRNRIVSGLGDILIVCEANKKSGTMNTVKHALDQGKDIYAIPFPINVESGTNELIKQGALLLDSSKQINDAF